jgi:hypothetical protein
LKKYKEKIYIWASDTSIYSGEGNLAKKYIFYLKKKYQVIYIKNIFKNKKEFKHKYIEPFYGILVLWAKFLKGNKTCYVNYLPMWNFLLFLILPPKTLIGPITGGAHNVSNSILNFHIRTFLFPVFYFITNIIFLFRFKKLIFATELLKRNIFKKTIKKSLFNFVYLFFKLKKKKNKKKKQVIIYYKSHLNKNYKDINQIIYNKYFISNNYKFIVVGEKLNHPNVKNKNFISKSSLDRILNDSELAYGSKENYLSLFSIQAINNNTKLIYGSSKKEKINIFKDMYLKINSLGGKTNKKIKLYKNDLNKIHTYTSIIKNYLLTL